MSQMVRMKFTKMRQLADGRTASQGDVAAVPYLEALDIVNCESGYPCNEMGGEEAMPEPEPEPEQQPAEEAKEPEPVEQKEPEAAVEERKGKGRK